MPADASHPSEPRTTNPAVILLDSRRFFARRIPIDRDADVAAQVDLTLETLSPFPPDQLYHGFLLSEDGTHALLYGAYRRHFSPDETSRWIDATLVVPEFLAWIRPGDAPALVASEGDVHTAIAWDEHSELPSRLFVREGGTPEDTARELANRAGLDPARVALRTGSVNAAIEDGALVLKALGQDPARLSALDLQTIDTRSSTALAQHRQTLRRDRLLWRSTASILVLLALCLVAELGLTTSHLLRARQQRALDLRAPEAKQIESAQTLAGKLEQISSDQLRPFEMLAAVNAPRPSTVAFVRVSSSGRHQLDIEARTSNAGDLKTYEQALQAVPGVERVELLDPRMRNGQTSFRLSVSFREGWLKPENGA